VSSQHTFLPQERAGIARGSRTHDAFGKLDCSSSVAYRTLVLVQPRGRTEEYLHVSFAALRNDSNLKCFKCMVSFSGPINETHEIAGVDSIDSLQLALKFMNRRLEQLSNQYSIQWDDGSPYSFEI